MNADPIYQGSLFTSDFLTQSITSAADWWVLDDVWIEDLRTTLTAIFKRFPTGQTPNESRTEDDLIWPILACLGWNQRMRQQNLTVKGRADIPDNLLFADEAAKRQADTCAEEWKRYKFGLAIVESKRWKRPLDRRSSRRGEELAPSGQILHYLRRVDDITTGKLRWGILTNGGQWRLYYAGARSVSEQFFEIDLAALLDSDGHGGLFVSRSPEEKRHALRVFALIFRREAFLPLPADQRTFHQRAIDEGKFYEERVAGDLSGLVFTQLYPLLARAIAAADGTAALEEVQQAAFILLYRLLFILYAEDRNLLPVHDNRYNSYGLRDNVRMAIGNRKDTHGTFSNTAARYWETLQDLCRIIDQGDAPIGLPPYNGGLFDAKHTPLLNKISLPDSVMADLIDWLSFERKDGTRKYINYRDLSVQQLGSIYERLLEQEVVREGNSVDIRPNIFARKGSGSYYTPEDLVRLIIRETLEPLIKSRLQTFKEKAAALGADSQEPGLKLSALKRFDPAERILDLRICDPAMGSGHFLVSLVDYLSDQVIAAMAETGTLVEWATEDQPYISPLVHRIEAIRDKILGNAEDRKWTVDPKQLDDRHIIRRIVLKRCVYGVDKNPMAVELAKVALWLHSFTVGAPLSFLDHHLRCGNSLFGSWVKTGLDKAMAFGSPLLLHQSVTKAYASAASMQVIEGLPDAEIAEAHRSQDIFDGVQLMTAPLNAFLSLLHGIEWLHLRGKDNIKAIQGFFDGSFGDPFAIALGKTKLKASNAHSKRFREILAEVRELITEEQFLHWQITFPGIWSDWHKETLQGGFDAIISNPPWDKMKLQQVEWFAVRRRAIALAQHKSDRTKMLSALEKASDPLAKDYAKASIRAEAGMRMARQGKDYPLLSGGDINLYALFVERAMVLVKPEGMVGMLTPSGIASDLTAPKFFKGVVTEGRLKALYDFENRRTRYNTKPFFPDVDSRFKFCVFVASPSATGASAKCAFDLQNIAELDNPERCFPLTAEDFTRANPNTGTAPIFRSRRDADLTMALYGRLPVLVDLSGSTEVKAWPVKYVCMFHMSNDSSSFRTVSELEEKEGAWRIGKNRFSSPTGNWVPLYEGKMVQAYDHRAASVIINTNNIARPGQPKTSTLDQHQDPSFQPSPRYYVLESDIRWFVEQKWAIAFKDITSPMNMRSMISCLMPFSAACHKLPYLFVEGNEGLYSDLLMANMNSIIFDYIVRQKLNTNSFALFILEQIPVIPRERINQMRFGSKTATEVIHEAVLALTYSAHDMAPFARDMGYVDETGQVRPPFIWDEERRLHLRAKLDAVFFHLYGITDRDDVRYVYSTFPIVERQEINAFGRYKSRDLCLAYMSALAAGDPNAVIWLA